MSEQRVGILYSRGPHMNKAIAAARARWPEARVIVFASESDVAANADEITPVGQGAAQTVSTIRNARLDAFIVMFASPRLELVASLSAAGERFACPPDGSLIPIQGNVVTTAMRWLTRRLHGERIYRQMRRSVDTTHVSKR